MPAIAVATADFADDLNGELLEFIAGSTSRLVTSTTDVAEGS